MKARIKIGAYSLQSDMDKWLKANAGKFVEIETEHLFTDQYNTDKYRIFDTDISEIQDDARIGKGKCNYCGKLVLAGDVCLNYGVCPEHGITWFTAKNVFFIAHPKGLEQPAKPIRSYYPDGIKIGTYTLTNFPTEGSIDIFRFQNSRRSFDFKWDGKLFWVRSCGYVAKKHLEGVPFEVERKLKLKLNELCMQIESWRKEYAQSEKV